MLHVWTAARSQPASNSSKLGSVARAFLRGLCNMELPYQLHKSITAVDQVASVQQGGDALPISFRLSVHRAGI